MRVSHAIARHLHSSGAPNRCDANENVVTLYFARIFFSDSDSLELIERITSAMPENNNNNSRFNCLFTRISIWHKKRIYGNSVCDEGTENPHASRPHHSRATVFKTNLVYILVRL